MADETKQDTTAAKAPKEKKANKVPWWATLIAAVGEAVGNARFGGK